MSALYLYAVTGELPAELGLGLDGAPLRVVSALGMHVVVSEVAGAPSPEMHTLVEHDRVVREVALLVRAVLPVRFGTLAASDSGVAALVAARRDLLHARLDLVRDRAQMNVSVYTDEDGADDDEEDELPALGPGTRYLQRARAAGAPPVVRRLCEATRALVCAERIEPAHRGAPARIYHLIARSADAAYREALAHAHPDPRRVRTSGPWPPYAFALGDSTP